MVGSETFYENNVKDLIASESLQRPLTSRSLICARVLLSVLTYLLTYLRYKHSIQLTYLEATIFHPANDRCHWFVSYRFFNFHLHFDVLLDVRSDHAVLVAHLVHADRSLRTQHRVDSTNSHTHCRLTVILCLQ